MKDSFLQLVSTRQSDAVDAEIVLPDMQYVMFLDNKDTIPHLCSSVKNAIQQDVT